MDMISSEPSDTIERRVPMSAKVVLYRKDLIDANKLRFVSERVIISEDLVWNMDVLNHSKCIVTLPQTFYYYYNNTASLSKKIRTDRFPFFKTMREALIKRSLEYHMPDEVLLRIDRMFIGYCRFFIGSILKSELKQKDKRKIVSDVCVDDIWKKIYESYPVKKMPKGHRLMAFLMKYNCYSLMSLVYCIKK